MNSNHVTSVYSVNPMTTTPELNAAYAAGIEPRHVSALVSAALKARAYHGIELREVAVHMADVESDGRRAKRTARALIDAGLLRTNGVPREPNGDPQYFAQIAPTLKLVEAERPNLRAGINDWQRGTILEERAPIGVPFEQLTLQQQQWVTTYPHEYRWQWIGLHKEISFKPGDALPEAHYRMKLYVSDAALRNEFEQEIRNRKIDALMAHNVIWMLAKTGADAEVIKTFMAIGDLGFGRGETKFAGDPATWAETAKLFTERAQAKLQTALKQVEAAARITTAVAQYGGWEKLGADLRVAVETKIDSPKTDDDDQEGAAS